MHYRDIQAFNKKRTLKPNEISYSQQEQPDTPPPVKQRNALNLTTQQPLRSPKQKPLHPKLSPTGSQGTHIL